MAGKTLEQCKYAHVYVMKWFSTKSEGNWIENKCFYNKTGTANKLGASNQLKFLPHIVHRFWMYSFWDR